MRNSTFWQIPDDHAPCRCSATVLKDGMEGKYEKEGYGQRLYNNWEKIMFDCEGEVRAPLATSALSSTFVPLAACILSLLGTQPTTQQLGWQTG